MSSGPDIAARSVVIATGVSYRRLDVPSLEALLGVGVFYGAAVSEAHAVEGEHVFVAGGGNSAGQAALHLARYAAQVTMLVRSGSLAASMSSYLIGEIDAAPNIDVRYNATVVGGEGHGRLERLAIADTRSGTATDVAAGALFVLIGGDPRTGWLPPQVQRDDWGFVLTGTDLLRDGDDPPDWPLERAPMLVETSMLGVFAVGDVRHGTVKRVAAAVGDGSIAIQFVHRYLSERPAARVGGP
jgi:thioredoxin reductase (NADPH)